MVTFAEKYNLVGQGRPVRISESTRAAVKRIYRESDRIVECGQDYARGEARGFGGCPQPGEPGWERYFTRE